LWKNIYQDKKVYLSQARIKFIIYNVLKAIDYMHKHGIFHRDIKP